MPDDALHGRARRRLQAHLPVARLVRARRARKARGQGKYAGEDANPSDYCHDLDSRLISQR